LEDQEGDGKVTSNVYGRLFSSKLCAGSFTGLEEEASRSVESYRVCLN